MYLDLRHEGISRTLAVHGIREVDHTKLFQEELEEGMIVVDIGANIGYYALIAASTVGKKGKVYAIEPDPRNFELLKKNIEINGFSDFVEAHQIAISDHSGDARFYLSSKTNLNTAFDPGKNGTCFSHKVEKTIDVKAASLDDFAKDIESINFIRMDIEGYEVEAFRGMINTLRTARVPCKILFEAHPHLYSGERDLRPVLQEVIDSGFKVKVVVSAGQAVPKQFAALGYKPDKTVRDGQYLRGFYYDMPPEHAIQLVSDKNKCVRYIMLERINDKHL